MIKPFLRGFLLLICSLALVLPLTVSAETPGTIVTISSDTTWTKENSPYHLTGPVLVCEGVTLTIEAGATVNFDNTEMRVNGTLRVIGTSEDKVSLFCGKIVFASSSNGWNEQTGSGCIIEHSVLESVEILSSVSLKIGYCSLFKVSIDCGLLTLSNSDVNGEVSVGASSVVSNNTLVGKLTADSANVLENVVKGNETGYDRWGQPLSMDSAVFVSGSSAVSGNQITSHVSGTGIVVTSGNVQISGNIISNASTGVNANADATIENNSLLGNHFGIVISSGDVVIRNNFIDGGETGIRGYAQGSATIERNMISNHNGYSINLELQAVIQNNTIHHNGSYAIRLYNSPQTSINYNNIEGYSSYAIWLQGTPEHDINATNNWWGTTDTQAINQSIYDSKYSFDLSTVTFIPILNEPNPQATPTSNPVIPEFPSWVIFPSLLVVCVVVVLFRKNIHENC